ncbi:zinc ribbon domain-containing protein [Acetanaerobacterium elongatum]|uniref:Zinc-ribbon domain-containing protein n=1 Tax=Acetanaerobacterium elongatum TaxID=258515 RepID=A0A1G9UTT2_9FIRM|nr:zinc ribbon domain-containing protein [Acetanaerobacterium elongatum]SDM63276.1 zinc-ribbon domain-containing protein [Acetanaerobacterium elongatum]
MGNFCTKCGAILEEDSTFCGKCGASTNKSATVPVVTTLPRVGANALSIASSSSKRNQLIGIIAIAVVAIIIIVAGFSILSDNYKFVIDSACQALEAKDYDKLINCFPPTIQETFERNRLNSGQTKKSYLSGLLGDHKIKLSYKVLSEDRLSKASVNSLFYSTDFYDDLETVYELNIKYTVSLDGDKSSSSSTMHVGKIKGKWYIIDSAISKYNFLGPIF